MKSNPDNLENQLLSDTYEGGDHRRKTGKAAGNGRKIRSCLGWAISIAFLIMVFRGLDWEDFFKTVVNISWWQLVILVLIYLTGYIVRSIRTVVLLPKLTLKQAAAGIFVGYAANNVLPARLGEFVRAQVVGKGTGISRATTLSNIIVERILDGTALVFLLFIGSIGVPLTPILDDVRWIGFTIFAVLFIGMLIVAAWHFSGRKLPVKGRPGQILSDFIEGIALASRNPAVFVSVVILSLLVWTIEAFMYAYGFIVCGIEVPLMSAFFVLGIVNLGVLIPSSPGYVGVFEGFAKLALTPFAVSQSAAVAYAIVLHVCQYVPVTLIGLWCLRWFGFNSLFAIKAADAENR